MVWLSPEQEQRLMGTKKPEQGDRFNESMTKLDRDMVGYGVRLDFCLSHSRDMRRYAEVIRGLADRLDGISRITGATERTLLFEVRLAITEAQRRMNEIDPRRKKKLR